MSQTKEKDGSADAALPASSEWIAAKGKHIAIQRVRSSSAHQGLYKGPRGALRVLWLSVRQWRARRILSVELP